MVEAPAFFALYKDFLPTRPRCQRRAGLLCGRNEYCTANDNLLEFSGVSVLRALSSPASLLSLSAHPRSSRRARDHHHHHHYTTTTSILRHNPPPSGARWKYFRNSTGLLAPYVSRKEENRGMLRPPRRYWNCILLSRFCM